MGETDQMPNESVPSDVLVTVVIAAYNAEHCIDRCLDSVEQQTYENLEIIVVDDGSTDDTPARLNAHAEKDSRVHVINQKNSYAGVARNNGLDHATGAYLIFLDSDDTFEPQMIEAMLTCALATDADVVVCRSNYYDVSTGEVTPISSVMEGVKFDPVRSGKSIGDVLFQKCFGWVWDKLYRTDFIRDLGLRFQDLRTTNDAYFGFMSMALAERIAFVDEPMVSHRINNPESLENTRNKSWDNALIAALTIQKSLVDHGIYDDFKQSYLNWLLEFFLWNFETLDDEARDGLIKQMKKDFVDFLPDNPEEGFYFNEQEAIAARLLKEDGTGATKQALLLDIDLGHEKTEEGYLREALDTYDAAIVERDETIIARTTRVEELEGELQQHKIALKEYDDALRNRDETISQLKADLASRDETLVQLQSDLVSRGETIADLEDEKQWIYDSTTFKVGRAITAAPRAVKRSLSKNESVGQ